MVKASAPGKLMLFGEHAVVYGKPCIVTAVDHRISASIEERKDKKIIINAPDVGIKNCEIDLNENLENQPKEVRFVFQAIKNFFDKYGISSGLEVTTKSEFSSRLGFGSSSAVTVATLKALSELFSIKMSNKEMFDLGYKTVLDVQGVGSGFDVAAAVYGETIYFRNKGEVIEKLKIDSLPLVVGYTGIKADTPTLVKNLAKKRELYKLIIDRIFEKIETIVENAKIFFSEKHFPALGEMMNFNHGLLNALGVSCKELEILVHTARSVGAYGAKLSGAGGGDCMIALVPEEKKEDVEKVINKYGKVIPAKVNAEGVRIENE